MTETKGILLCCWGKVGYGYAAFNLAASIRFYSPTLPITLITDGHATAHLQDGHKSVFTDIIVTGEAVADPGGFKASLYARLPYTYTLFLDVDALCVKPLEPLFDRLIEEYKAAPEDKYFRTHIYDWYDKDSPNDMPLMYWARRDVIWDHYGFKDERLPATQSSLQFYVKCPAAENFYKALNHTYHNDYIPLEALKHRWGGTQPDELYLNITIAKFGTNPEIGPVMWFCDNGNLQPHQVKEQHYFLSYFGVRQRIKSKFVTFYDNSLIKMLRQMGYKNHMFKSHHIFQDKHANKFVSPKRLERQRQIAEAPLQVQADSEAWASRPGAKQIHLFTTYYGAASPFRQRELDRCVFANLENPYITRVFLLSEIPVPIEHPKLTVIQTEGRITMAQAVEIANKNHGELNILCNSDIYMNATIGMVQDIDLDGAVLCLSRWEEQANGSLRHYNYEYSQDTWVWEWKLTLDGGHYNFGLLGCDNKFAHDLFVSGYRVLNPSRHIKTIHVHLSNVRHYSEATRLPRPYRNVPVCSISELPRKASDRDVLLIRQPGKTGDILKCLPIAQYYAGHGYEVLWECPDQYHTMFAPYVDYVRPVSMGYDGRVDRELDLSFGLNTSSPTHKRWMRERARLDSFVTLKYDLAGVPVSECFNLTYKRNEERENALAAHLGLQRGDIFVLVHLNSDYGTPVQINTPHRMVEFAPVGEFTIYDWRLVIEWAAEIHCIDSSLCNLVDVLPDVSAELYYYITDRVPKQADRTLLQRRWNTTNLLLKPSYANS